jgi:hypothetical protein
MRFFICLSVLLGLNTFTVQDAASQPRKTWDAVTSGFRSFIRNDDEFADDLLGPLKRGQRDLRNTEIANAGGAERYPIFKLLAEDQFAKVDGGRLAESLRLRMIPEHVGTRETVRDLSAAMDPDNTSVLGALIEGKKGSGKSHTVDMLEYEYRRGANMETSNTWWRQLLGKTTTKEKFNLRLKTEDARFKDLESVKSYARSLAQNKAFREAESVNIYIDNLEFFKAQGTNGAALLDSYVSEFLNASGKNLTGEGPTVKFIFEGSDPSDKDVLLKTDTFGRRGGRALQIIKTKPLTEEEDILQVVENALKAVDTEVGLGTDRMDIALTYSMAKSLFPGGALAQKTINTLERAVFSQRRFLKDATYDLSDEVIDGLNKQKKELEAQLEVAKASGGKNALRQQNAIPKHIAEIDKEIAGATEFFEEFARKRKRMLEIKANYQKASRAEKIVLSQEYSMLFRELSAPNERVIAHHLSQMSGARLIDILNYKTSSSFEAWQKHFEGQYLQRDRLYRFTVDRAEYLWKVKNGEIEPENGDKPLLTVFLAGLRGTGKSLYASLLRPLVDDVITINGGEYTEAHRVSTLLGSPPGYVGSDQLGILIQKLREGKTVLIWIDEVEKAHPDLIKLLNGLLDPGIVNDAKGNPVSCQKCIVVATSNAGAKEWAQRKAPSRLPDEVVRRIVNAAEPQRLLPEFLDRFKFVGALDPLRGQTVAAIFNKFVRTLNSSKTMRKLVISVEVSTEAEAKIISMIDRMSGSGRRIKEEFAQSVEQHVRMWINDLSKQFNEKFIKAATSGDYITKSRRLVKVGEVKPGDLIGLDVDPDDGELILRVIK